MISYTCSDSGIVGVVTCYRSEVGLTDLGGCVTILPEIKWTLTFGDLVAAVVPVLAFLAGMYLKQYFWNKEKFNNEYTELVRLLRKLNTKLEGSSDPSIANRLTQTPRMSISKLIRNNPMKFEDELEDDWDEVKNILMELIKMEDPSQEKFEGRRDDVLRKLKWLINKIEKYYRCHSPRRWKYRITTIPAIVKGWFAKVLGNL